MKIVKACFRPKFKNGDFCCASTHVQKMNKKWDRYQANHKNAFTNRIFGRTSIVILSQPWKGFDTVAGRPTRRFLCV